MLAARLRATSLAALGGRHVVMAWEPASLVSADRVSGRTAQYR